jgi:two-component system, OmpR family, alkaline phosphatase synthesis response regulator PhoP
MRGGEEAVMTKKILVVDDDPDFVEATATLLEARGYDVITASDGEEGFDRAKQDHPALILLDVMMKYDTQGFDIAKNLKNDEQTQGIPVVIITGVRREKNLPFSFEPDEDWLPVKAVLEKPLKPETLLSIVEENVR